MASDTQADATRIMSEYQKAIREQQRKYEATATAELLRAAREREADANQMADAQAITISGLNAALTECMSHLRATNEAEQSQTARADALSAKWQAEKAMRQSLATYNDSITQANLRLTAERDTAREELRTAQAERDSLRHSHNVALQLRDNAQDSLKLSREENNEICADYERAVARAAHDSQEAAKDRQEAAHEIQRLTANYNRLLQEQITRTAELHSTQEELSHARKLADANYNQFVSVQAELYDTYGSLEYWTTAIANLYNSESQPPTRQTLDMAEQSRNEATARRESIRAARKAARA